MDTLAVHPASLGSPKPAMLISRIENRKLGVLCERVGVAFEVGQDPYRIFERESGTGSDAYSQRMRSVADRVMNGSSLAEAVEHQGNYFPPNFINFIEVGEKTGRLDRVLSRMADYYKNLSSLKDDFISSIIWPLVQLVIGLIVVSVLIYMPVIMQQMRPPVMGEERKVDDLLGLGLIGWSGLAILWSSVAGIAVGLFILYVLVRNGRLSFLYAFLTRLPVIGRALLTFDEASFIQTLSLAIESGVNASDSIELAFKTCSSQLFRSKAEQAYEAIRQGHDMHTVLQDTKLFSADTIDAVQLGEESGRLAETLDKHYGLLQMRVRFALTTLNQAASTVIWIVISAFLIFIIFRMFGRYLALGIGGVDKAVEQVFQNKGGS